MLLSCYSQNPSMYINRIFRLLAKFCFSSIPKTLDFQVPTTTASIIFIAFNFGQKNENYAKTADMNPESTKS